MTTSGELNPRRTFDTTACSWECECSITMDDGFVLQADVPREPAAAAEHQALGHPVTLSTAAPGQPDREVP